MSDRPAGTMAEDYVKVLWKAEEWSGAEPTTNELAATLGVAPSSVSGNLKKLARDGLIDYEPYGRASLTAAGRELAAGMVRRHRILETFLVERFGYTWDEVHAEAEILEHAVSDRLLGLIDADLGFPAADPHGDPIPRPGEVPAPASGRRLHDLPSGSTATVLRVSDHDSDLLRYLGELSIGVGTELRLLTRHDFAGSLSLEILGQGAAPAATVELAFPAADAILVLPRPEI